VSVDIKRPSAIWCETAQASSVDATISPEFNLALKLFIGVHSLGSDITDVDVAAFKNSNAVPHASIC
jgi:Na+/pantothenate symporter